MWQYSLVTAMSGVVIMLSALYSYLIFFGKRHNDPDTIEKGNFWSLKGVVNLFKSPRAVLAGWIHYLAFDLAIGVFIAADASNYDISHFLLTPIFLLTLMFGPAGLLAYFILKGVVTGELVFTHLI